MQFTSRLVWPGKPSVKVYVLPSYPRVEKAPRSERAPRLSDPKVVGEAFAYTSAMLEKHPVLDGQALILAMAGGNGEKNQLSVFAYDTVKGAQTRNPMIHYQRFDGEKLSNGSGWVPVSMDAFRVLEGEIHHRRAHQRDSCAIPSKFPDHLNPRAALSFQKKIPLRVAEQVSVDGGRLYIFKHPDRKQVSEGDARAYFTASQKVPGFANGQVLIVGGVYRAKEGGLAMDAFGYSLSSPGEVQVFPMKGSDRLDPWGVGAFCETEALLWAGEARALRAAKGGLESICQSFPGVPREFRM
ncbi:MAG: hypothetical protein AABX70_08505 [Nanoarchaeota archaeon]